MYLVIAAVVLTGLAAGVWFVKGNSHSSTSSTDKAPPTNIVTKPDFKEFGITVNLPEELKNLKYVAEVSPDKSIAILMLQLDSYDNVAGKCLGTPGKGIPALATLKKIKGQYNSEQIPKTINLKQFDSFYIGGNLPVSLTCKDQTYQAQYDKLADQLTKAIETTFANAIAR